MQAETWLICNLNASLYVWISYYPPSSYREGVSNLNFVISKFLYQTHVKYLFLECANET